MKGPGSPPFALPSRYVSENKVLRGGQGEVYFYRDKSLDRLVAVKTLRGTADPASLVKEVEGRAKIKSKHVAEVYDLVLDRNRVPVAIIMECVPGESLDHPSVRSVSRDTLLLLLYQIACGISDMHAAGVIHRDIKPTNMKVDSSGVLKIFDLGIANIDAASANTVGGAGTIGFRAPELYGTLPARVTPAADVYALGITAWWLLTNFIPPSLLLVPPNFVGLPRIETRFPGLKELGPLIDKSLSEDPAHRPSSEELRQGLATHITHDRRRGVFSLDSTRNHELSRVGSVTRLQVPPLGSLRVAYSTEGRFIVRECDGDVYINNKIAAVGDEVPDSCVVTFGPMGAGASRRFIPFDVSQPEIVL
jgi:serine/threonine protein kinase